ALDQVLRGRTERLTAGLSRTNDLDEVTQHLSVVDDARENSLQQMDVALRKDREQQRGHVLHVAAFACEYRELRNEARIDLRRQFEDSLELVIPGGVESRIQA